MNTYSPEEQGILEKLEKELPGNLTYHGLHHTLDVFQAALKIAAEEKLSSYEIKLLRIAVLYHDAGFTKMYKSHEERGCELVRANLPAFGYSEKEISIICGMIMATKIPQSPATIMEKIICDADLDYLGRGDFKKISDTLFEEMKTYVNLTDEKEWFIIQKKFLENHRYYTDFGKINREPVKQQHLKEISRIVKEHA